MIYLWKLFIEWAVAYPPAAFYADIAVGILIVILIMIVVFGDGAFEVVTAVRKQKADVIPIKRRSEG